MKEKLLNLPKQYSEIIESVVLYAQDIFQEDLVSMILGGSCGKGMPIVGWSDIDLYVILNSYQSEKVRSFFDKTEKEEIHIGLTFYTTLEVEKNLIDNKTKIMLYEKNTYHVNPTLYGDNPFQSITFKEVAENDKNNLPNVLHDFRRMYIKALDSNHCIDQKYIKKFLLLLKCYLSNIGVFNYGYQNVFDQFQDIYNEKRNNSTTTCYFDIMDAIVNIKNSKEKILDFSKKVLEFIIKEIEVF